MCEGRWGHLLGVVDREDGGGRGSAGAQQRVAEGRLAVNTAGDRTRCPRRPIAARRQVQVQRRYLQV